MILRAFGADIAEDVEIYPSVRIWLPKHLTCRAGAGIGPRCDIYNVAPVTLGEKVNVSQDAYICTASHDLDSKFTLIAASVCLEAGVWLGAKAVVLPGVKIGRDSVVGACAVVAKSQPPMIMLVGNPARRIEK